MPLTIGTSVRSLAPRRISARTNAIGVAFIDRPPIAIVAPSGTSSAASSSVLTLSAI